MGGKVTMNVNVKVFYGVETADEFRVPLFAADDIEKIANFLEIEPESVTPGVYKIGGRKPQIVEEKSSLLDFEQIRQTQESIKDLWEKGGISFGKDYVLLTPDVFLENFKEYTRKSRDSGKYPNELVEYRDGIKYITLLDQTKSAQERQLQIGADKNSTPKR